MLVSRSMTPSILPEDDWKILRASSAASREKNMSTSPLKEAALTESTAGKVLQRRLDRSSSRVNQSPRPATARRRMTC
jgi:hypothetical protein